MMSAATGENFADIMRGDKEVHRIFPDDDLNKVAQRQVISYSVASLGVLAALVTLKNTRALSGLTRRKLQASRCPR